MFPFIPRHECAFERYFEKVIKFAPKKLICRCDSSLLGSFPTQSTICLYVYAIYHDSLASYKKHL